MVSHVSRVSGTGKWLSLITLSTIPPSSRISSPFGVLMNYIQVSSPNYFSIALTVNTYTARETRRVYMVSDLITLG